MVDLATRRFARGLGPGVLRTRSCVMCERRCDWKHGEAIGFWGSDDGAMLDWDENERDKAVS